MGWEGKGKTSKREGRKRITSARNERLLVLSSTNDYEL